MNRAPRFRLTRVALALLTPAWLVACQPEAPPRPDGEAPSRSAAAATAAPPSFSPERDQFVLTYAGDRGALFDSTSVDEVPEQARGMVGVSVFGKRPPADQVWVANLTTARDDGSYELIAVARREFEEVLLGAGRSSSFELPAGLELPDVEPARDGPVIVYKTSWCGVCKQVEAYLDRKGIEYVAKDIEQDRTAAAELAAKAKQAGVPTGSVPMIDVGGELLRGFDRARLEQLL